MSVKPSTCRLSHSRETRNGRHRSACYMEARSQRHPPQVWRERWPARFSKLAAPNLPTLESAGEKQWRNLVFKNVVFRAFQLQFCNLDLR
jgi:hypothetical protein